MQFFSRLKEAAGCAAWEVELSEGARLHDLVRALLEKFPQLAPWDGRLLLAVGLEYATPDHTLREGDEVSIMPPVQGG